MAPPQKFPKLPERLRADLAAVQTVSDGPLTLAPSQVTLRSGEVRDRVYVVETHRFIQQWGWDSKRRYVRIEDVVAIRDSPSRLPARFADQLYAAGESGMGYVAFAALLKDGSRVPFIMGNAVDFPSWPAGLDPDDVVEVMPHPSEATMRDLDPASTVRGADYAWCLYSH